MATTSGPADPTGTLAASQEDVAALQEAGFYPCRNQACRYFFHPHSTLIAENGDALCPGCEQHYNFNHVNPFSRHEPGDIREEHPRTRYVVDTPNGQLSYNVGGGTIAGQSLAEQGVLAEQIVEDLGELPGYGPITGSRATYHSPTDLTCGDWGVEVKSANFDGKHHRFWPGSQHDRTSRDQRAQAEGYKGILGVLVVLNYRESTADVYVREMPFAGVMVNGQMKNGLYAYRSHTATQVAKNIPFTNPLLQPHAPQADLPF
jgi:hypothetical protein